MAQPREACSHTSTYLQSSPIGQLFTWATKSLSHTSHQNPSSRRVGSEPIDEASIGTSDATKGAPPDEEDPVELHISEDKETAGQERQNEAHDWSLTRRVAVASIICLYT